MQVRGIMSSIQTNKRRRTIVTHINDLPVGILVDVSAYLSKPSRALLAVAFTAPSTSWQNNDNNLMHRGASSISTAIVSSSEWGTLDFEDIEKSLAKRLSDDDMFAILVCINAQDVLKKLKLTGYINITGQGLSPLRRSVVLEQIDLSLIKQYEDPDDYDSSEIYHSMSKAAVLPILDNIISSIGCSLKHILLPYSWRTDDPNSLLCQFLNRYNQNFDDRGVSCSGCDVSIQGNGWFLAYTMYHYNTCYDCLKHYCRECSQSNLEEEGSEDADAPLNYCNVCKKDYCKECDDSVSIRLTDICFGLVQKDTCIGCQKEKEGRRQKAY